MNIIELLKSLNGIRGRKFFVVLIVWYLVFNDKASLYWAGSITLIYFILDTLEKLKNKDLE